jgi:hypothetical protein
MHDNSSEWLSLVREKVESLRFGVVQIVIHNSKVTQIERTEKTRLESRDNDISDRPDKLEEPQPRGVLHRATGRHS